jgi:8-oxo-dGTP pyrophosphatase MutT (NUDIX family)
MAFTPQNWVDYLPQAADSRPDLKDWMAARLGLPSTSIPHLDGRPMMTPGEIENATPAAVLVPLVNRPQGVQVLLTQRTSHLSDHAGQISFPGGRIEASDESAIAAALRETEEEIGLPRGQVELLGQLREFYIPTGYRVVPAVGWVEPPFTLQADPHEVAEIFEVPLLHFCDPQQHVPREEILDGQLRRFYAIPFEHRYIWGATAGILVDLFKVLSHEHSL